MGRAGAPLQVLRPTWSCSSTTRPTAARDRRKRASTSSTARRYRLRRRRLRRHRPASWSSSCWPGPAHGLDGFRLRPAVIGHDLDADRRRRRPRAAGAPAPSAPPTSDGTAPGAARPRPPRQPLRHRTTADGPTRSDHDEHQRQPKQVILAAYFPGVNNTTVWSDPRSRSQIEFDSFVHLAQTAERGKLDFFFLAEGLRLREQGGKIHDLDVVGRPDTLTVLTALAVGHHAPRPGRHAQRHVPRAVRAGPPAGHARPPVRRRAAWNVVTSSDAFTGENFRRGGFLTYEDRYERAGEFVRDAPRAVGLVGRRRAGGRRRRRPVPAHRADAGAFAHHGPQFDIRGHFNVPAQPAGPPGDPAGRRHRRRPRAGGRRRPTRSSAGTPRSTTPRRFYADVKGRLARYGRSPRRAEDPARRVVRARRHRRRGRRGARRSEVRRQQVSPQTAILLLEQLWNRDLSAYDPDGPAARRRPRRVDARRSSRAGPACIADPLATAAQWRELAEAKNLSDPRAGHRE